MSKSLRSFVLVALFAVSVVPTMQAERAGTNPRPSFAATSLSQVAAVVYTVLSSLSL